MAKIIKRNNKNQVKQPTAQKSVAKPEFYFNGQRFSPEILTARGERTLFAKAQAICSIRELPEIPVEPNDNRITALILSIPAFIVWHCSLVILLSIFEEQNPVLILIS